MNEVVTPQLLTGWGRSTWSAATIAAPRSIDEVVDLVNNAPARGILARGMGRSYGDAAQNAGGTVLDLSAFNDITIHGRDVRVGAGVVLSDLIDVLLAHRLFVPVTPGTSQVTVAGLLAADVHGKNHHIDGSWANHVTSIEIVTGDGQVRTLRPDDESAQHFWATAGGMGLTGIVTALTFTAIPVASNQMSVTTRRIPDLGTLMDAMRDADTTARYSVAWIDSTGLTGQIGRGILTTAEHDDRPGHAAHAPRPTRTLTMPARIPSGLLRPFTVGAFNSAYYRLMGREGTNVAMPLRSYFHPLDGIAEWNRVYGRRGFVQYQFVVPDASAWVINTALQLLHSIGAPSAVSVLKRFGAANPGPLSFPMPGWTLALDIPIGPPALAATLDHLDDIVITAGGREYLAKDARMSPWSLRRGYPRLGAWQETAAEMDPRGIFTSDLDRRLNLRGDR